jgi:hypothetical protein
MLDICHLVRCGIWAEEGDAHWKNSVPGRSAGDKIYKMLKWPRLVSRTWLGEVFHSEGTTKDDRGDQQEVPT